MVNQNSNKYGELFIRRSNTSDDFMNNLPLPKPKKKEKVERGGMYRKNFKPLKSGAISEKVLNDYRNNDSIVPLSMKGKDLTQYAYLFKKYYHGIANISPELYAEVKERSGGICEICHQEKSEEIHHLAGRRRMAWIGNLLDLGANCHKPPQGIHANKEIYEREMKKLQDRYFQLGYSEENVRFLLGTKSNRLF